MGDQTEHGILGALISLAAYVSYKTKKNTPVTIYGVLGSLLLGGLAGVLPDILEPANNPSHRSFFHSISLLVMLAYGNQKVWKSQNLTDEQKLVVSLLSSAYASHLLSDSSTPKSIPFIL